MSSTLICFTSRFRFKGMVTPLKNVAEDFSPNGEVFKKLRRYSKANKMDYLPEYICPVWARRVLEVPKPSLYRRILKNERFRKRDRDLVRTFCNYIIYIEGKHKSGR